MPNIIQVILTGDVKKLTHALDQAARKTDSFHKGMRTAGVVAGGALVALGVAAKMGFDEFNQAEKVTARTNTVLKSTAGIAGVTAGQVDSLANALMRKSGVDDEAIQSGENVLLTFTKVHGAAKDGTNVFDRATRAALDYSVATGKDMTVASMLVGRALQDPIGGLSRLTRVGVTFDAAEKARIKTMVEAGNVTGAQGIILDKLEQKYKGSAEAAGKTFAGKMNIARETIANTAGSIVGALLPAFTAFASIIGTVAGFLERHKTLTMALVTTVAALTVGVLAVNAVMAVHGAVVAIAAAAHAVFGASTVVTTAGLEGTTAATWGLNAALLSNPIFLVIVGLVALGAALYVAWTKSETFRAVVTTVFGGVKGAAVALWGAIKTVGEWFGRLFSNPILKTLGTVLAGPFVFAITHVRDIKAAIGHVLDAGKAVWNWGGWHTLGGIIAAPFNAAKDAVQHIVNLINDVIDAAKTAIGWLDKIAKKAGGTHVIPGIDIPGLPLIGSGGIVTRRTLAVVGESGPEAVIPLNRAPIAASGGGDTYVFNFPQYIGSKDEVVEVIRRELIRQGRRMPAVLGGLA